MTARRRPRSVPLPATLFLVLALGAVSAAHAQKVVWVGGESEVDSLRLWATQARALFQGNVGDSAGGANYRAYERVGLAGRRLLRSLGRDDLRLAPAIQPTLDSLGLVTEIATDPGSRNFALMMVRDPVHLTAQTVGFLYWYKGDDLRMQGVVFRGGREPRIRAWWTGTPGYPYECGVLDATRAREQRLTLLRLAPDGTYWSIQQDEESFPTLGEKGTAQWVDLNNDGHPELISWTESPTDSLFVPCSGCPRLITERTFIEGRDIFERNDERLLPTPYATLVYFVRLLIDGKLDQAEKLVRDPARVREAVAEGWNQRVGRSPWTVEFGERGEAWPRRLEVRFQGPRGTKRYGIVFGRREGHWVIENWFEPRTVRTSYPSVTIPPATPPETKARERTPTPSTRPVKTR